jgi:hypothetical protein
VVWFAPRETTWHRAGRCSRETIDDSFGADHYFAGIDLCFCANRYAARIGECFSADHRYTYALGGEPDAR